MQMLALVITIVAVTAAVAQQETTTATELAEDQSAATSAATTTTSTTAAAAIAAEAKAATSTAREGITTLSITPIVGKDDGETTTTTTTTSSSSTLSASAQPDNQGATATDPSSELARADENEPEPLSTVSPTSDSPSPPSTTTTMTTLVALSSKETLDDVPDSDSTKGPAVADRRVQTTESPAAIVTTKTNETPTGPDGSGRAAPSSDASDALAQSSGPASQPPQSPRNPKYVDIDSVQHPEEPPPEMPSKPFPQNITVRLENLACEHPQHERPGLRIDIEKTFKQLAENISDVQLADASCKMFLTLNLTVTATDGNFKRLLAKLEEHVKNITVGEHMIITGFTLHDGAEHQVDLRPTVTRAGRFPTYREELIILVAVIVLLCIVLFIACVICSIRCCRRSPSSKTLDLLEAAQTPRSRGGDFSNRIPRPHTLYSPTASEYSGCLSPMTPFGPGIVQPFDTCLVPLEDVTPSNAGPPPPPPRVSHSLSASVPVDGSDGSAAAMGVHSAAAAAAAKGGPPATRPNNLPIRSRVDFSPDRNRFRSYNYPPKHSRTLPSAIPSKNFGKGNATQSTEQLTKNHSLDDDSGVDNPTYLPTPSTPHVSSDIAETHKM